MEKPKEFNKRNIDVSYRANDANKYIGLYGYDKAMIGELFTKPSLEWFKSRYFNKKK